MTPIRMPRWSLLLVLAAAMISAVAACDRGSPGADPTATQVGAQKTFATPQPTATSETEVTAKTSPSVDEPVPGPTVRGGPPPRILEVEWKTDKGSVVPGEPVTITLELKNVWDKTVEFNEFPTAMTLTHVDTRVETSVPLELESGQGTPGPLGPGESLIVVADVSSNLSAGLLSGRYRVRGFQFTYSRGGPGFGPTRSNMGSDPLFVVIPQEGVLDKVLTVGQTREAGGTRITLERILFTPEQTIVSVFAVPPAQSSSPPQACRCRHLHSRSPCSAWVHANSSILGRPAVLGWRCDRTDGVLQPGRGHVAPGGGLLVPGGTGRRALGMAVRPGFSECQDLELVIVPKGRPGGGGASSSPGEGASSSWEWSLSLQRPDLQYSMADLSEWNRTLRDVIWQVSGITYTYLDEPKNRIRIGMEPRRGAREKMQAAIESVGVPHGAALIDVGCSGIKPWPLDEGNLPTEAFLRAVDYSLEVEDQVSLRRNGQDEADVCKT